MILENLRQTRQPITVAKCARFLGMNTKTLRTQIKAGQFPAKAVIRVGTVTRIDPWLLADEIEAAVKQ